MTPYGEYLKPRLESLLEAAGLNKSYERAVGDYLFYTDENEIKHKVVDFLGGYGVSFFGHNHPALVEVAEEALTKQRPFAAQASIRTKSGQLAQKLSSKLEAITKKAFVTTLANSGAEIVEAAIKHAMYERHVAINEIKEKSTLFFKGLRLKQRHGLEIPASLFRKGEEFLGTIQIHTLNELEFHIHTFNENVFNQQTKFLTIEGSFHGKTSGALKLTSSKVFREPWESLGISTLFIKRNDLGSLSKGLSECRTFYISLDITPNNEIQLTKKPWTNIIACFIEPIQGEGGIHELEPSYAKSIENSAIEEGFPLIIDEIQSGMGRTGYFVASETLGIIGDYYLFSKALGGGLAKIAALLIRSERYIEEFGYLHTSTFAEDDFSSSIALRAVELLEENEGELLKNCQEKGNLLKQSLKKLVETYPSVFKEVRGRGLMIGLEIIPQLDSDSSFIKLASEQSLLLYLICGYLLNVHNIRVTPTLSEASTLRLEPSVYISKQNINRLIYCLEDVATQLINHNSHALTYFIYRQPEANCESYNSSRAMKIAPTAILAKNDKTEFLNGFRKVACIGHFMKASDLINWDNYLAPITEQECSTLLKKTQKVLKPFLVGKQVIFSNKGVNVELEVIGIPYTAEQIISNIRDGKIKEVFLFVEAAHRLAVSRGNMQIGFTGYTSIATNNCTAIIEDQAGVTSGNSLTVGIALESLHQTLEKAGIDPAQATLGIVGGAGNIGKIIAHLEFEKFAKMILIGRPNSEKRLRRLALDLITNSGIKTKSLKNTFSRVQEFPFHIVQDFTETGSNDESLKHSRISVSTDMSNLKDCSVIITATNTADVIIYAEHLSEGSTIICDISVPADVDENLINQKPNVILIRGGRVLLPLSQKLSIKGLPLEDETIYACIAETILLGLSEIRENYSYGPLEKEKIQKIISLCHEFEFSTQIFP